MTDGDAKAARAAWMRALSRTAAIEREPETTLPVIIDRLAEQMGAAPALVCANGTLSYLDLSHRNRQIARWGISLGLEGGDVVALLMPNRTEYLCIWFGLTRIGATVALVNSQLTGNVLAHSINTVAPKHLDAEIENLPGGPLCTADYVAPSLDATALYIFTSGTTGLPKAARVSHHRVMQWSHWFAGMMDTSSQDRMYNCLPLYHSVGGVVATGATLVGGGAVVIRARFSASDFWRDVHEEQCTIFQYIGELCRYLVNSPHHPEERQHSLRLACGNGLRPEVWETFQQRFKLPRILEYYASTEGNFSLYNCESQPGSIGRIPAFLAQRLPVALLRFDVESTTPKRDAAGFCERAAANEIGEAVGLITDVSAGRVGRFEGYTDQESTERKVLRNVFKAGDAWYRTGDLMRRDDAGFYYFVDRVGDTYRWKGENVSTAEVLSTLCEVPSVLEGVVYGVAVPGADGRAGMAALVVDQRFDLTRFHEHCRERLPAYARPVFLRLIAALESTGTFKPRKQELVQEGFDPALVPGPLYVIDLKAGRYVPLDPAVHAAIRDGKIRV
jgi:fatty-acyl-CoA synthase